MTDQELTALYFTRDERALEATETAYGSYCRAIAQRILGNEDDAEECLSDVWLRVWNAIPPERPAHFKGWLGVVTRNQALTLRRNRTRQAQTIDEAALELAMDLSGGPEAELETRELGAAVSAFLRTQPEANRNAFLRRYWYGDSMEEVSRRLGWSVGRTKSTMHRMRKKLREYLQKEEFLV